MLVLLSFVLVLVATVLLVLGLLVSDDGITLIYFSIGMSAVAAALLVVAVRKSKPTLATAGGPAPLPAEDAFVPARERELATVGAPTRTIPTVAPAPEPAPAAEPVAAAESVPQAPPPVEPSGEWLASDAEWGGQGDEWGAGEDLEFPIADYDDLTIDEVLPLLPQLYSDELDVVEAREREGLNRREVLDRLAELRVTGTDADRALEGEGAAEEPAPEQAVVEDLSGVGTDATWEPEVATEAPAVEAGPRSIPGYDTMAVSEIVGALGELSDAELDGVRAHEAATKNRRTVLAAIDRRLGVPAEPAPAAPVAARKAAPAKKATPARRKAAPAKKAAPARKKAAPAKKAAKKR